MPSNFLNLNLQDVSSGLVTAILAAVFTYLAQAMNVPGFHFASINWAEIIRVALMAAFADLGISLGTTKEGKLLGMVRVK